MAVNTPYRMGQQVKIDGILVWSGWDTKQCPVCKDWYRNDDQTSRLLSTYDTHVLTEHPDLLEKQENFMRDFYKISPEMSLEEFFRDPDEERRKEQRKMASATKEKAEKAPAKPAIKCLDGCGMMTKPGRYFLPGHDARLKSKLIKLQEGNPDAPDIAADVRPLLKEELFKGRFAEMANPAWKRPATQQAKGSTKADATEKLAQISKKNDAGQAARKAAVK